MNRSKALSLISILAIVLSFLAPVSYALASAPVQTGAGPVRQPVVFQTFWENISKYLLQNDTTNYFDLRLRKYADEVSVNAGDPIGFTIVATSIGTRTLENVIITDQLDPSLGWTENSSYCSIDGNGLLTCSFGDMAPQDQQRVHITARSNAEQCGILSNEATGVAVDHPMVFATATIDIHCTPNVRVEKLAQTATIQAGDTARYTLRVTSDGQGTATDVTLTDTLPSNPGLSWVVDSVSAGDCEITSGTLNCAFGDLPSGEIRTVVVSSPTTSASCGDIDNSATVSTADQEEINLDDNTASATITVNCSDLMLEKLADAPEVNANDEVGFTITVTNIGTTTANNVTLTDTLDEALTWTEDSAACSISSGNLLSCSFGSLMPQASASVHVSAVTTPEVCGLMENTASASASNVVGSVTDSATVQVNCAPQLEVVKEAENDVVPPGDMVSFTMTVTNTGAGSAEGVILTDTLPADPELVWSFDNVSAGGECQIAEGVLTCDFGTLDSGESASVRVSAQSTVDTCGNLINTVNVTAINIQGVVSDISQVILFCSPNVGVVKTAEQDEIIAGEADQPARFTITVTSNGNGTANNVLLTDVLPANIGLNEWVIESVSAGTCSIADGTLSCNFGNMAVGETFTVVFAASTVREEFCQATSNPLIENTVTITSSNEADDALADNASYAAILVRCRPVIEECTSPDEIYFDDFENPASTDAAFWSNYRITTSPNGTQTFLGDFSNEDLRIDYPDLDENGHFQILVSFDLYVIRSWDGNNAIAFDRPVGPDHWLFNMLNMSGGVERALRNTSFTNYDEPFRNYFRQSFPFNVPAGDFGSKTGAIASNTLGYDFAGPRDSVYHFSYLFQHTDPTVRFSLSAAGLQPLIDESWGIDNFRLQLMRCNTLFGQQFEYFFPEVSNVATGPAPFVERRTDGN